MAKPNFFGSPYDGCVRPDEPASPAYPCNAMHTDDIPQVLLGVGVAGLLLYVVSLHYGLDLLAALSAVAVLLAVVGLAADVGLRRLERELKKLDLRYDQNTTMTGSITVTREPYENNPAAERFFDTVAHGSAETGDYPFIYKVEVGGEGVFYGFKTNLPSSREPWTAEFREFERDTVINAETGEEVTASNLKHTVNRAIDLLGEQP